MDHVDYPDCPICAGRGIYQALGKTDMTTGMHLSGCGNAIPDSVYNSLAQS